ncbi:hypothetical protein AMJ49_05005 [Parcubacteria bacterium DG_74_2]|nr:MAG: hypothetical protein AMJ49_05005 [Parcubacteria bacterium DG_74_2]
MFRVRSHSLGMTHNGDTLTIDTEPYLNYPPPPGTTYTGQYCIIDEWMLAEKAIKQIIQEVVK